MIEIFTLAGNIILGLLLFLLKFIGSLCLIALVLIVFVILFISLIGGCYYIGRFWFEMNSELKEKNNEERNNDCNNA